MRADVLNIHIYVQYASMPWIQQPESKYAPRFCRFASFDPLFEIRALENSTEPESQQLI